MSFSAIDLAETGWLPDSVIRAGIRRLLAQRLRQEPSAAAAEEAERRLRDELRSAPLVVHALDANQQHYEVPAAFFQQVLGPHLKYSSGYWPEPQTTLAEAEAAMLQLTVQRAQLNDGMQVLELGCGWGSLSLWMAENFPQVHITAVSNSHGQKAYIDGQAERRGLNNLEVITANIADFQTNASFDRVISVEMFEHVRNHGLLLARIADWLKPSGCLFVHIFCHRRLTYLFETEGRANWMGRHFFTGGMMPSANWLRHFDQDLQVDDQWQINGRHYQRTCEAWLQRLDAQHEAVLTLFREDMDRRAAQRQLNRWRIFFMACAELFGYHGGEEWFVSHYRFSPSSLRAPRAAAGDEGRL